MAYVPPHKRAAAAQRESKKDGPLSKEETVSGEEGSASEYRKRQPSLEDMDFFYRHLYTHCETLRRLQTLKEEFENEPTVERMFRKNRAHSAALTAVQKDSDTVGQDGSEQEVTSSRPSSAPDTRFANQFKGAMEEVAKGSGVKLQNGGVKHFLDLGCAPGGFSRWVLEQNADAHGLGVTLPPDVGGLPMILDGVLEEKERYRCLYRDVTDRPEEIWYEDLKKGDGGEEGSPEAACDLVIAGSIYRDQHTADPSRTGPPPMRVRARQLLSFSQLLAAMQNLAHGGTMVIVSNIKPQLHNLEQLCFLRKHFDRLTPVKPTQLHTIRSSYYLVAAGFNRNEAGLQALDTLRQALARVRAADDASGVDSLLLLEGSEEDIVKQYASYVTDFYEPLWSSQARAIESKLADFRARASGFSSFSSSRQRNHHYDGQHQRDGRGYGAAPHASRGWRDARGPRDEAFR
ncbi:uncharacterized protein EV422DRAFT_315347 [Fimicolochytrium jonesii]|uniref:uncharacterized protein n=1 Tax=Fimicolochytrium jonesii TaxID=1396493 RepID=UPI0022FE1902|nr:uncharacterized protein EV422DRAFT_315347 [Fimicolochytrium jonesii]KAI8824288.1 hypothetical protein EV422DRAFT_315347 [Fimicolochytrium jonesii]